MTESRSIALQRTKLSLPSEVKALCGSIFDPRTMRWTFHDGLHPISVNFGRISPYATNLLIEAVKFPMIWYAENTEGETIKAVFHHLKLLIETSAVAQKKPVEGIDAALLINYRATLDSRTEGRLGSLTAFLKKWHSLGIPGITDDAIRYISSIRLKGYQKGAAVLTMDPVKGPLTIIERSTVQAALNDAFAIGNVSLGDYLLAWLFLLLGQRNIQFAMLKVCDLSEVVKPEGARDYVLRVPRAKQHDSETRRDQFTDRLLISSIGKLLWSYAECVRIRFKKIEEYKDDASQAPLFPTRWESDFIRPSFHYHASPSEIGIRLRSIFDGLKVYSERTGKPIKVGSKRLRHTLATTAAREGHGELIIAELLDHSDTQNVGVYVKATPEIVERIDRAVALRMAPLAHAFSGTVIHDESEALRGKDHTSRIVDPRFDEKMKPMGNCGRSGPCSFMAPIACYTCNNFQAWADGPHEAVLSFLITERERLFKDTDERIATVNDRTILAVADVINLCRNLHRSAGDG